MADWIPIGQGETMMQVLKTLKDWGHEIIYTPTEVPANGVPSTTSLEYHHLQLPSQELKSDLEFYVVEHVHMHITGDLLSKEVGLYRYGIYYIMNDDFIQHTVQLFKYKRGLMPFSSCFLAGLTV